MLKYAAIAVVALAGATPALAQDAPALGGGHVEAIAGWDHAKISGLGADDGIVFGIGAGYDFNISGTTILGVEGEASFSTADACNCIVDQKRDLYAGVRVGTEVAPGTLAYLKAGYSNLRVGATGFGSANADGVRVGLGVEHRLSGNVFVKGEYRYTNYEAGGTRNQVVAGLGLRF